MLISIVFLPLPSHAFFLNFVGAGALSGTALKVIKKTTGVDPAEPVIKKVESLVCRKDRSGKETCRAVVRFIIGELISIVVDPSPTGYISSGAFVIDYPSDLLEYDSSGWLGAWGSDPSLATLPANPNADLVGTSFFVQQPNVSLFASVSLSPGIVNVQYDWGVPGLPVSGDPFNFYAVSFSVKKEINITSAGPFDNSAIDPAGNFGVANGGSVCYPPTFPSTSVDCGGEDKTERYEIYEVPGPIPILGIAAAFSYSRKLRKRIKASKPELMSTTAV